AYPECQQAFTYCAILEKNTRPLLVGPPDDYDVSPWLQAKEFTGTFFAGGKSHSFYSSSGIFRYRRVGRAHNSTAVEIGNLSTLNWGNSPVSLDGPAGCGNDFKHGVLVGNSREERQEILKRGRDRTRSYIHFLQTQVASDLSTSPTMSWTPDGIALEPYIRESRRGIALTTIRHEDVAAPFFSGQARARTFNDSVGIGHYHYLDFHPNLAPGHVELTQDEGDCAPFTIALGAMVPIQTERLILSAKSIGTTHITNSAYRMHPVEWAIGEAGGYLAAFCQAQGITPRQVAADMRLLRQFQGQLATKGIPLFWFNDVGHDDPDFEAIQVLATAGIVRTENRGHLNFNPAGEVSRGVVAVALVNVLALPLKTPAIPSFIDVPPSHFAYTSIEVLKAEGIVSGVGDQKFAPERPITREHFAILMAHVQASDLIQLFTNTPRDASVLRRRELSRTLYRLLKIQLNS
ncbi:MAG: FAD-dependent oxidoreductase, partial [Cyanobacteria bacterium P01_F01_bin.42]